MITEVRKRKLPFVTKGENGSIDVDSPQKRHRKSDENAEDGSPSIGQTILLNFTWLIDATTKNYFVDSIMSAFNLGSRQNRKKQHLKPKCENLVNEEENEEQHSRRCDLKRTPLRETYKRTQNKYLTLPSPVLNETNGSSNMKIRNMPPNGNSNALEKRKVIENPFKSSQKFRKADSHLINNMSNGRKIESNKTDHCGPTFVRPVQMNTSCATNSVSDAPSRLGMDAPSAVPQHRVVGGVLYKHKGRTTEEIRALHEKYEYKRLLDEFTKCNVRRTSGKCMPILQDKEVQTNLCGPVPSNSLMHTPAFKKDIDHSASNFLAKYFKGHSYGITPNFTPASKPLDVLKNVATSPKKTEKEDDIIIAEVKIPKPRLRQPSLRSSKAPFSPEWFSDLKKSLDETSKKDVEILRTQEDKVRHFREQRAARLAANDKAFQQLQITDTGLPEAEVDTSVEFPELTPTMEDAIDEALINHPPDEVLSESFNISISRKDIEALSGLNWLNDEIINFYMNLLIERSEKENYPKVYVFNTFFYPKLITAGHSALKRWTKKKDIFAYDMILVPVHMGMHWCLAVIDFRYKKIRYYDSMGGQNTECLNALRDYLQEECMDKKKENFDMSGWVYENVKNIPHQMNGSDCGMFTLKYAEYITRDAKITFTQDHMQYFRRRMVYEILTKQLL